MALYADLLGGLADDGLRVGRRRLAGGWCWQRAVRRLRDNGHDAYPVTLTGLGERVHLASPEVDLETHITDVVNLIEFEELYDIVLIGHRYAGLVVTGAADRIRELILELVYLDTAPLPAGNVLIETFPPTHGPARRGAHMTAR